MWSKLSNKFPNLFKNKSSQNPKKIIDLAITEIESAIQKNQASLENTKSNQVEVEEKLQEYQSQANKLYQLATNSIKQGKEAQAQVFLERKAFVDKQVEQYQKLYQNVTATVRQLQNQIDTLKLKIVETRSKETVLQAKLESAQSQQELSKQLQDLDQEGQLDLYEEEVTKIEIQNNLTDDFLNLENQFDTLNDSDSVEQVKAEILQEEKRKEKERLANQLKRVEQLFSEDLGKEQKLKTEALQTQQKKLLQKLLTDENLETKNESMIDDFFALEKPDDSTQNISNNQQNQKLIDDFFKNA